MKIIFTEHSERKIEQRRLNKSQIKLALKNPDFVVESYEGRKVAYKKFSRLYLAIVFKIEKENLVVITSHWDEGFKLKNIKKEVEA